MIVILAAGALLTAGFFQLQKQEAKRIAAISPIIEPKIESLIALAQKLTEKAIEEAPLDRVPQAAKNEVLSPMASRCSFEVIGTKIGLATDFFYVFDLLIGITDDFYKVPEDQRPEVFRLQTLRWMVYEVRQSIRHLRSSPDEKEAQQRIAAISQVKDFAEDILAGANRLFPSLRSTAIESGGRNFVLSDSENGKFIFSPADGQKEISCPISSVKSTFTLAGEEWKLLNFDDNGNYLVIKKISG